MVNSGHAEYIDEAQTVVQIYVKPPSKWAFEMYAYMENNGVLNQVFTVYELHAGDEMTDASRFYTLFLEKKKR